MELSGHKKSSPKMEEDGESIAQMLKYIFGFSEMGAIRCAIELKIADIIEAHGGPMTLAQLSSTLNCCSSLLYRILRFLIHRGIFKEETTAENLIGYAQTPLSRLLATNSENNMSSLFMLHCSPVILGAWQNLSVHVKNSETVPFQVTYGKDFWSYVAANPEHNILFNEAMACSARLVTSAVFEGRCLDMFNGVRSLVDVGGGNGTTLSILVKACPWIRGINFDLPHVVSASPEYKSVEHVAGDMFNFVPKADAALLQWILHDWNDEKCIKILKNCKKAIPEDTGKVIIVEAIIDEKEENKFFDVKLMLDLVMMTHTNKGKERTREEWIYIITTAGFSRYIITPIQAIQSVIQCFP